MVAITNAERVKAARTEAVFGVIFVLPFVEVRTPFEHSLRIRKEEETRTFFNLPISSEWKVEWFIVVGEVLHNIWVVIVVNTSVGDKLEVILTNRV